MPHSELRVVLLAHPITLRSYGPALRRLTVGLLDEVGDLSILSLGPSELLNYAPSPPVRLIIETQQYQENLYLPDQISRKIFINTYKYNFKERIWPQYRVTRIADTMRKYKPTILHALSEKEAPLAGALSKQLDIPYLVSLLKLDQLDIKFHDKQSEMLLPCNSLTTRLARKKYPAWASRIVLLPIGTHIPDKTSCFSNEGRQGHLFCRSPLEYNHGLTELINAVKQLDQTGHKLHLSISGEGPAEHILRQLVDKLSLTSRVHFVPPIDTMLSSSDALKVIFEGFDIFIQPYATGRWQPELPEAMSVGNAIVASEDPKNDLLIEGKTALLYAGQSEKQLAEKLDYLLKNHDQARQLAQQGQSYLRKHYLASKMVARLAKAYRSILEYKYTKSGTPA